MSRWWRAVGMVCCGQWWAVGMLWCTTIVICIGVLVVCFGVLVVHFGELVVSYWCASGMLLVHFWWADQSYLSHKKEHRSCVIHFYIGNVNINICNIKCVSPSTTPEQTHIVLPISLCHHQNLSSYHNQVWHITYSLLADFSWCPGQGKLLSSRQTLVYCVFCRCCLDGFHLQIFIYFKNYTDCNSGLLGPVIVCLMCLSNVLLVTMSIESCNQVKIINTSGLTHLMNILGVCCLSLSQTNTKCCYTQI